MLRCGVPPVVRPPGDTNRVSIVGVAWYPVEAADAVTWTTVDQPVPVEVRIPSEHAGQLLARLAEPILAAQRG